MLRLLKSGECSNLGEAAEAAEALGYSWRQSVREVVFASYREESALQELLKKAG
jgi:hypothetical protein